MSSIDITAYWVLTTHTVTSQCDATKDAFWKSFAIAMNVKEEDFIKHVDILYPQDLWHEFENRTQESYRVVFNCRLPKVAIFGVKRLNTFDASNGYLMVLCEESDLLDLEFCSKYKAAVWFTDTNCTVPPTFADISIPTLAVSQSKQEDVAYFWSFCERHVQSGGDALKLEPVLRIAVVVPDDRASEFVTIKPFHSIGGARFEYFADKDRLHLPNFDGIVHLNESLMNIRQRGHDPLPTMTSYLDKKGSTIRTEVEFFIHSLKLRPVDQNVERSKSVAIIGLEKDTQLLQAVDIEGIQFKIFTNLQYWSLDHPHEFDSVFQDFDGIIFAVSNQNTSVPERFVHLTKPRMAVNVDFGPNTDIHMVWNSIASFCGRLENPLPEVGLVGSLDARTQMVHAQVHVPGISFLPFYPSSSPAGLQGVVHIYTEPETYNLPANLKNLPFLRVSLEYEYRRSLEYFCRTQILKEENVSKPPPKFKVNVFGKRELYNLLCMELQDMQFKVDLNFSNQLQDAAGSDHILYVGEKDEPRKWWVEKLKTVAGPRFHLLVTDNNIRDKFTDFLEMCTNVDNTNPVDEKKPCEPALSAGKLVVRKDNGKCSLKEVDCVCTTGTLVLRNPRRFDNGHHPVFAEPNECIPILDGVDLDVQLDKYFVGKVASLRNKDNNSTSIVVITAAKVIDTELHFIVRCPGTYSIQKVNSKFIEFTSISVKCRCCRANSVYAWRRNSGGNICIECCSSNDVRKIHRPVLESGLRKVFREYATHVSDDNSQVLLDRDNALAYYQVMHPEVEDLEKSFDQFVKRLGEPVCEQQFVDFYVGCIETHYHCVVHDFHILNFVSKYCSQPTLAEFTCFDLVLTKCGYLGSVKSMNNDTDTIEIACFGNPDVTRTVAVKDIVHAVGCSVL